MISPGKVKVMRSLQEFLERTFFSDRQKDLEPSPAACSHLTPIQCNLDVPGGGAAVLQPSATSTRTKKTPIC